MGKGGKGKTEAIAWFLVCDQLHGRQVGNSISGAEAGPRPTRGEQGEFLGEGVGRVMSNVGHKLVDIWGSAPSGNPNVVLIDRRHTQRFSCHSGSDREGNAHITEKEIENIYTRKGRNQTGNIFF